MSKCIISLGTELVQAESMTQEINYYPFGNTAQRQKRQTIC